MNVRRSWLSMLLVALLLVLGVAPVGATDGNVWTPPENLSDWRWGLERYRLAAGSDGTLVSVWPVFDPSLIGGWLAARVRSPGAEWSPVEPLSEPLPVLTIWQDQYWGAVVAPDGTAWVAWTDIDSTKSGDNRRVMVARRPPGGTWQREDLSGYETEIRSTDLAIGPDGHLAVAWVACTTNLITPSQGPCALKVRRRLPGAAGWEPVERLDQPPSSPPDMGIWRAYVLVGPGGLTVVVWMEANPANSSEWKVRAARLAPPSTTWQVEPDVSDGWYEPPLDGGLAQPAMGEQGTVVVAWTADYSLVPWPLASPTTIPTHESATLDKAGNWSPPAQLTAVGASDLRSPWLSLRGGVTVAVWERQDLSGQWAIYANARDAGGTWGSEVQLSSALDDAYICDLEQWPGGTAVVLWEERDATRAPDADSTMRWKGRPPGGAWGDAGQGQFGDWAPITRGGALALDGDGSGVALWATEDSNRPANEQGILLAARWPPGGPAWSPPEIVQDGYKGMFVAKTGVTTVPGGRPIAASWMAFRPVSTAVPNGYAVFFSELAHPKHSLYLPLLLRNAP